MKKRAALFNSVIALILCVAMLAGSTFAWFTDSVTNSGNIIKSGKLDLEVYWAEDMNGTWNDVENVGTNKIFDYKYWEPGYTQVRYIKIVNAGDLAFRYALEIKPNGEVSKLADVIDVYAAETIDGRADLTNPVGTLREAITGDITAKGELTEGEVVLAIALKMREDAGNEYQNLSIGDSFGITINATQYTYEEDSFGDDYDTDAALPGLKGDATGSTDVETSNGVTTAETTITTNTDVKATVPAGVKVEDGKLSLSVTAKEGSDSNITAGEGEDLAALDVHIEGVASDNTTPILVELGAILAEGFNQGNMALYHVENGTPVAMTQVLSMSELDAHNEYYYDPATGIVTVAMATFSELTVVSDTENAWEGEFDYTWYDAAKTELTIANADQLAGLSAIVGGMNGQTQDSFAGKTVKLISDINLGDKESENNPNLIFYPIGYYNSEGTYERTNTAITSGLRNFEGTFDGNGHTIANFYHNTWEMKGDHDWYSPEEQYYRDGMGLFGRVYGGTVKNLTVKNFSSDGEIATTGVIAAYADGATFENIAIFNCNPRVYNIGNGGIVGCVGWYAKEAGLKTTFKNITVDNGNKISALWGSYDVACGGIVGQYYPTSGQSSANYPVNAGIHFENCHVSAQMDVYNDVCANYQYYAYRYTGMLIGSVRENETIDGHVYPDMTGISASGCTVHFGDWNDYYYCELVANSLASYTHDHQMSRLEQVLSVNVANMKVTSLKGVTTDIPTSGRVNYVVVKAKGDDGKWTHGDGEQYATCYHFVNGVQHKHDVADNDNPNVYETVNGVEVLKEDKHHIYLEFNNLVTGYGWGVTSMGLKDFEGVEILDITQGDHEKSVEKFKGKVTELANNKEYKLGDIFTFVNNGVEIVPGALTVTVTNVDESQPVSATIVYDRNNWENGTITLTGTGKVQITIQDYYFCKETTINVTIADRQPEVKFETKFTGDFLYRVGNVGTVALGKLFAAKNGATIGNVSVSIEAVDGTAASGTYTSNATWTNGTIQFSGTGVVKVTITDNDYCIPTELYLEVVDAYNATAAQSTVVKDGNGNITFANNVVLLNDIGSGFTVSGRYTVYGNGFTLNYTGNGQYLNNGLKQGVVTVSENGTLDNLRIEASIYPTAYMYYGKTTVGEYVQGGPSSVEGDKTRYHYQLSAVAASGNATIQNCYIYGGRNNIFINTGDVTVKDTVLECGTLANVQVQSNASHTVTFENVTTIQHQEDATIGDTSQVMFGAGIVVGPETTENPTIVLKGRFKQYNWVNADDAEAVTNSTAQMILNAALEETDYNHTVDGKVSANLGIVYMNEYEAKVTNDTGLPYKLKTVNMEYNAGLTVTVTGQVYSLQNATANQIYSDVENANRSTENGLYEPQFKYSADLGGQYIEKDSGDEHCYREGDTIHVLFPSGDTKELNLATLVNIAKYSSQELKTQIVCEDENGNEVAVTDGKVSLSAAGEYTVTYTVTDTLFYDKDGKTVSHTEKYSWDVSLSVSLKDTAIPDARFEFDATKQKMGYNTGIKHYLPFLAGLKIYDYNGQTEYLRFDGDNDFNKVASITITGYESNKALVEIKLTDGGVINTRFLSRANSGGASTYTGKIKVKDNVIYFVNDGTTANKDTTTTAAYWYVDFYKFTGNNGVAIQSAQQTFNSTGSSAKTPSGSFSTTINYTVNFDANGGNCGQNTGYATSVAAAVTLPTPTRSGYIFAGWYTAASGGTRVGGAGDSYTPSSNITLYAQWGKPCTVTYNANGGSCGTASEKYTGTALTLPTPTRDGYWFIGWYDAATGGNKIGDAGATYNPSNEITLYAHWQEKIEYTVTYNANGGSVTPASATYQGSALTLPTPTRTGYTFNGWYTATSGGTKIGDAGASYIPSSNITLYAQWEALPTYTITIEKQTNATVTVDKNSTFEGDTVTVTVSFSQSNSRVLTVKDASGNTVLSKSAEGTYTFTMPASNVTIEASSEDSCIVEGTLITMADGTQKPVEELVVGDMILAFNHVTGKYEAAPLIFNTHADENEAKNYDVLYLQFSDGKELKIVASHGLFDMTLMKYVYVDYDNYQEFIGHEFYAMGDDGSTGEKIELVNAFIRNEKVRIFCPVTYFHMNSFANGLLNTPNIPGGITGLVNYFEYNPDLKYNEEAMQRDIEKYGLYTYEDFSEYISEAAYLSSPAVYLKVAVGKGMITYEQIIDVIRYLLAGSLIQ